MKSEEIIQFILNPQITGWLLVVKIVFLCFSSFFFGYILWGLFKTSWLKKIFLLDLQEFLTFKPIEREKAISQWAKIKKRLESNLEPEIKLAVIEADSLVEEALKNSGYSNGNFEAILNRLPPDFPVKIEQIRQAHKIRDNIVYDPNYKLELNEAKEVLKVYEEVLKGLDFF